MSFFRILVVNLFIINTVFAFDFSRNKKNCSKISLPKKSSSLYHFFSVPRNQREIGWCYAHTAADLLSNKLGVPISANHVASIYNSRIEENHIYNLSKLVEQKLSGSYSDLFEGGFTAVALRYVIANQKVCPEAIAPSTENYPSSIAYNFSYVVNEDKYKRICRVEDNFNKNFMKTLKFANGILREIDKDYIGINNKYKKYLDYLCKDQMIKVPKEMKVRTVFQDEYDTSDEGSWEHKSKSRFLDAIDKQLERENILEFSYRISGIIRASSGKHSSIIVGREWRDGKCYYRIRNSTGTKVCREHYVPEIAKNCDTGRGEFLISDKMLYEKSLFLNYIE